jgi:hypothetical protein
MKHLRLVLIGVVLGLLVTALAGRVRSELKRPGSPPTPWAVRSSEATVTLKLVRTQADGGAHFRLANRSGRTISCEASGRTPFYRLRRHGRLVWEEVRVGWCGNGAGTHFLPDGAALEFDFPCYGEQSCGTFQIGIGYEDDQGKPFTVWSEPFTVSPP